MPFRGTDRGRDRRGFTIVELAVVLIIASIMIGMAVPRMQSAFTQRDVTGGRDGVMLLASRARARAMERGRTVQFQLNVTARMARIVDSGVVVEAIRFGDDLGLSIESSAGDITMCYSARGFAVQPCSTTLSAPATVRFYRGGRSASLEIWQLGQVRKL